MNWHTYAINPIDFCWSRLKTVEETAAEMGEQSARARAALMDGNPYDGPDLERFLSLWDTAQTAAAVKGWEGDFRNPPVVFWLPGDSDFDFGFVIKQDNNGTTFVMSPVPLPHLAAVSY